MLTFWKFFSINDWLDWTANDWLAFEWSTDSPSPDPSNQNMIRPNQRGLVRYLVRLLVGDGPRP